MHRWCTVMNRCNKTQRLRPAQHYHPRMSDKRIVVVAFYAILFLVTLVTISITTHRFPLFPFQTDSLEWSNAWLAATVVDYYGTCLCFCGVVLSSESNWFVGLAWVLACCLLGSPVCCFWVLWWLSRRGGTLRLKQRDHEEIRPESTNRNRPVD